MTREDIVNKINEYKWYHSIEVIPGVSTQSTSSFPKHWKFISDGVTDTDLVGKSVLDVGCRDGLFCFQAEHQGASRVLGIDNNLSKGAVEFLIPFLKSKVRIVEKNLYQMNESGWDVIFLFGVLYHLRFPFAGLAHLIDLLKMGGVMLIETAAYVGGPENIPLLYCPWERSPYEQTSVSFINETGMGCFMRSIGCQVEKYVESDLDAWSGDGSKVRRAFFVCRKISEMNPELKGYWVGTHHSHNP